MKKVVFLWTLVLVAALSVGGYINNASAQVAVPNCPAGTYQIGSDPDTEKPICKAQPTGCPYGDSIPLNQCVDKSDKPLEVSNQPVTIAPSQPQSYYDQLQWTFEK